MKRVSDPPISPSGKWVMFSVTEVDLEKNSKVNHLWVVPMADGSGREADSSAALRNDNKVRFGMRMTDKVRFGMGNENKCSANGNDRQKCAAE